VGLFRLRTFELKAKLGASRKVLVAVACAFLTTMVLLLSIVSGIHSIPAALRVAIVLICICECLICNFIVWRLLRPIGEAAEAMRRLSAETGRPSAPGIDDLQGLLADIRHLSVHLAHAEAPRTPGRGIADRETFFAELDGQMQAEAVPALLAVVRMGDFDRVAAFDSRVAKSALDQFGERLRDAVRKTARTFQLERDCFAVWFPSTGADDPVGELRAISYVLGQDIRLPGKTITPDVRLGCAMFPRDGADAATLLACATAALPSSPGSDATVVNVFTPVAAESARRIFLIQQGLHEAIAEDQFFLEYQPVVDLREMRVVGAEALLRWVHPELGRVSPTEFIPIVEQTGLIDDVGAWVLNTACREARDWRRRGLADLTMAVNVSARQFRGPSLIMTVVRTLERHGLAPAALEIELTETAAMEDSARTREMLQQFQALGVGVAIDDFGVGFSSLSYLKNLPFTKLKIDREFIVDVHQRTDSQAICSTLIALARGLRIEVLAEGVERLEEVEALLTLGCATFQGYFFARPQPAEEFVRLITDIDWLARLQAGRADPAPDALARRRA
jgi:EAL domain-containing protein (putative c-di-GMP-specific phosphodiesterase class I)/GGDEF domain-containing protein